MVNARSSASVRAMSMVSPHPPRCPLQPYRYRGCSSLRVSGDLAVEGLPAASAPDQPGAQVSVGDAAVRGVAPSIFAFSRSHARSAMIGSPGRWLISSPVVLDPPGDASAATGCPAPRCSPTAARSVVNSPAAFQVARDLRLVGQPGQQPGHRLPQRPPLRGHLLSAPTRPAGPASACPSPRASRRLSTRVGTRTRAAHR